MAIGFKSEMECCSLAHCSFGPSATAVTTEYALYGSQANTGAFELGYGMETLEGQEQFIDIGHIEAGAVVAHEIFRFTILLRNTEFYPWLGTLLGKLPGIAQQVVQHYAEEVGIASGCHSFRDDQVNLAFRLPFLQFSENRLRHFAKIDSIMAHFGATHARQIQQIISELCQAQARSTYAIKIVFSLRVQFVSVVFRQCLAEAGNRPEWGTLVM